MTRIKITDGMVANVKKNGEVEIIVQRYHSPSFNIYRENIPYKDLVMSVNLFEKIVIFKDDTLRVDNFSHSYGNGISVEMLFETYDSFKQMARVFAKMIEEE